MGTYDSDALYPAKPTHVRWNIVLLLMLFSFTSWFTRVSTAVADTSLKAEFGFSDTQIGFISSALLVAYTACMTPGGWFIDRFGTRLAMAGMGFGSALFGALTSSVSSAVLGLALGWFIVVRACVGACTAPIYPACARAVASWMPFSQRAVANGLINGAAPLGISCAHVLLGAMLDHWGWRTAFFLTGLATASLALGWTWYSRDTPEEHSGVNAAELALITGPRLPHSLAEGTRGTTHGWHRLFLNRSLLFLTLSYAAVGYFEYQLFFCTEAHLKGPLGYSEQDSRWYAAIGTFAMAFTMPTGGLMSDLLMRRFGYWKGRAAMPVFGLIVGGVSLYCTTHASTRLGTVMLFTIAHAAIGCVEGACWSTAVELGGRRGGTSAGIFNTGGNLGGVLPPVVNPYLIAITNYSHLGLVLASVIAVLGAILWLWIDPAERLPEDRLDRRPQSGLTDEAL